MAVSLSLIADNHQEHYMHHAQRWPPPLGISVLVVRFVSDSVEREKKQGALVVLTRKRQFSALKLEVRTS